MNQTLDRHVIALRIFHGILTIYFTLCLFYLYFVGFTGNVDSTFFTIAILSLALEGVAVFVFNSGNCPLIHIQRKIGDNKPFFELIFPPRFARQAIPAFAGLTLIALLVILLRSILN